jgi:hypothetical protein
MRMEPAGREAELLLDRRAMVDVSCDKDEGFEVAKRRISVQDEGDRGYMNHC